MILNTLLRPFHHFLFFYCVQIRKFNMYLLKVAITFVELKKAGSWQTQNQKFHWSLWNSTFLTKLSGIDLHVSYEFLLVVLTKTSYQTLAKTMGGRPDCNMKFLAWALLTFLTRYIFGDLSPYFKDWNTKLSNNLTRL